MQARKASKSRTQRCAYCDARFASTEAFCPNCGRRSAAEVEELPELQPGDAMLEAPELLGMGRENDNASRFAYIVACVVLVAIGFIVLGAAMGSPSMFIGGFGVLFFVLLPLGLYSMGSKRSGRSWWW